MFANQVQLHVCHFISITIFEWPRQTYGGELAFLCYKYLHHQQPTIYIRLQYFHINNLWFGRLCYMQHTMFHVKSNTHGINFWELCGCNFNHTVQHVDLVHIFWKANLEIP